MTNLNERLKQLELKILDEKFLTGRGTANEVNFWIVDYGCAVESDSPYELYVRGKNSKNYPEGLGIGLYVAKNVAVSINANISHKNKLVSYYNVPLLQFYDYLPNQKEEFIDEINRLEQIGLYEKIVNNNIDIEPPPKKMVIDQINYPTYEVIFEVNL